jgi:predicted metal-dependent hydrolase
VSRALRQLQLPFDVSPVAEKPGRPRQVQLPGGILGYRLVRARRRSVALFVDADGLEARVPRWATVADVEAFIRRKETWIRRRLAEPRRPPFVWETGARLPWLGQSLTLASSQGGREMRISGERLEFGLDDGSSLRERALEWVREQALAFFRERIDALSRPHALGVSGVGLSNARSRWGSCSSDGRVLLNWRLMLLPPRIIDYVVAHELAHRVVFNHSARFWNVVAELCPGHRALRQELNALAKQLPEL